MDKIKLLKYVNVLREFNCNTGRNLSLILNKVEKEKKLKKITKEDVKSWAETYDEAIETLMWIINHNYTKDDMIESITDFKKEIRDE